MKPEYLVLLGTLGGALIGSVTSLIAIWITKSYEEKKQKRELLINAGIEYWKKGFDMTMKQGGALAPLEDYIIHMLTFADLIVGRKLTSTEAVARLQELQEISDTIVAWRTEKNKEKRENKDIQQGTAADGTRSA